MGDFDSPWGVFYRQHQLAFENGRQILHAREILNGFRPLVVRFSRVLVLAMNKHAVLGVVTGTEI